MASIGRDKNGRRRILFVAPDEKRKTIRLGKIPQRAAEAIKVKVEHLVSAAMSGCGWDNDTSRWVADLPAVLAGKLATVGLIPPRATTNSAHSLGAFLDAYIESRAKLKPNTRRNYETTRKHLLDHFGAARPLATITPGEADDWQETLRKRLSEATVSREVKRARQFFRAALRKRLISENPFADLSTPAQVNASREHFVCVAVTEKVLAACPDEQWRLIVALSRYGGLRCPSEHLGLTWGDVDWEHQRITIRSPKTAHHASGGSRVLPLFPELRPILEAAFDAADPGTPYVITRYRNANANLRTQFLRIIARAGVKPWPKLFHNLRASRQTELTGSFPLHVVCEWIGNTALIAEVHYLQVTDDHYQQAVTDTTERGTESARGKCRNYPQSGTKSGTAACRSESHRAARNTKRPAKTSPFANQCAVVRCVAR